MYIPKKKNRTRKIFLSVIGITMICIYVVDLFSVQIVHGDEYRERMNSVSVYTMPVKASRGEILDRNGESLVSNRQGYSVIFDYARFPSSSEKTKRNAIINSLLTLFHEKNCEWNDGVPLMLNEAGEAVFPEDREPEVLYMKSEDILDLNDYATPQNCLDAAIEKYELSSFDKPRARELFSVYFSMFKNQFSASSPYTFAEDVPMEVVAHIKENSDIYPGVDISIDSYREYPDGKVAPHLIGTVGVMSSDEYESKSAETREELANKNLTEEEIQEIKKKAYAMDDDIGKSGIESVMESYLRGSVGEKTVVIRADGSSEEYYSKEPSSGNTVILTIDKDIQQVTQQSLEKRILELTAAEGLEAAGAAVVIDCTNGDIIAAASYPSYDLSTYYDDYDSLVKNPASPLWDRTVQSTYAPGSTMKPVMALAALQEGVIDEYTTFYCDSVFEYLDQQYECLDAHGSLDVRGAINHSCNIFFYNVADKLGIKRMNTYSSLFGLGSKTGIEIPEVSGVLAGPDYRESKGLPWYSGDTIQAAIGQSDNLFTPIQLANYCATIANNGTRYVPHVIKSVKSSDYAKTIFETKPEIAAVADIDPHYFTVVKEGMRRVVTEGFCQYSFANVPVSSAAKTGTSQVKKIVNGSLVKGNNGFVIAFAPYEDPKLAVAIVIENVDSGTATSNVAADIFEYYFSKQDTLSPVQNEGTLLH